MRLTRVRITITAAAIAGLVSATQAQALGLGEISVSSNLNQRFAATIPLTEISSEELETVTISIAPNEAFENSGIERSDYLSTLDFEIRNDNGRPRVVVSSREIAREPVVDLLVQARWSGGKIARNYTILLDPPEVVAASAQPPAVKPVAVPAAVEVPVAAAAPVVAKPSASQAGEFYQTPTEAKPATKPAPAASTPVAKKVEAGRYGPVTAEETLWSIAKQVRPTSAISMDEAMLALAEANPTTIMRGTTVTKGAMLQVPSAQQMLRYSRSETTARLAALRTGSAASKHQAVTAPSVSSPVLEPAKPDIPVAAVTTPVPAAPAPAPAVPAPAAVAPASAPETITPAAVAPEGVVAPAPVIEPEHAVAAPAQPAPASPKSPLAQPLPEPAGPGLFEEYGAPIMAALLLLLLVIGAMIFSRRRKAAVAEPTSGKPFESFSAADVIPEKTPTGAAGAISKLGDTSRVTKPESTAAMPAVKPSTPASAPAPAPAPAAFTLDPEMAAILNNALSSTPAVMPAADKTTQLHVETLQINLGDNDPLSEADFHLAYGLYDEAILLLQTATAKQPDRVDLKVKLAETYFAAGRPMEFQELAEDLQPHLGASEWGKVAIMGTQLCPGVAMFKNAGSSAGLDTDFDLDFDEPAAPAAANSVNFSLTGQAAKPTELSLSLDDSFSEAAKPAAGDADSIDFMLSQSLTPLGAVSKPAAAFNLDSPSLEIGIPEISSSPAGYSHRSTIAPDSNSLSLSLQTLENSMAQGRNAGGNVEDELNTKLDLARAYVEMGDNEMARSLLKEVQQQGGDRHQQEAAALLLRLPA